MCPSSRRRSEQEPRSESPSGNGDRSEFTSPAWKLCIFPNARGGTRRLSTRAWWKVLGCGPRPPSAVPQSLTRYHNAGVPPAFVALHLRDYQYYSTLDYLWLTSIPDNGETCFFDMQQTPRGTHHEAPANSSKRKRNDTTVQSEFHAIPIMCHRWRPKISKSWNTWDGRLFHPRALVRSFGEGESHIEDVREEASEPASAHSAARMRISDHSQAGFRG